MKSNTRILIVLLAAGIFVSFSFMKTRLGAQDHSPVPGAAGAAKAISLLSDSLNCTFTEQGIQQIVLGGKHSVLSAGTIDLANPPSPASNPTIVGNAGDVRITHQYGSLVGNYVYSVKGHDILINVQLVNTSDQPFNSPVFSFPTFNFSRNASGNMHSWHPTYLAACGLGIYHPGMHTPLAAGFAHDDTFGICLHVKSHLLTPTLINANWVDDGIIPAQCTPNVYIADVVPAHAAVKFEITLRVTDSLDLPDLLGAYIADYKSVVPPLQYTPDDRPVVGCYPEDVSWMSPTSPLGLHSARRLDTPGGIIGMERMLAPSIGVTQGTIFWQPQGWNPRGAQFRPDFDCWPPTIRRNLPVLINWFKANHLSFGLCARAAQFVTPVSYEADNVFDLDCRNQGQLDMEWIRFQNVIALGVSSFYLDTFGVDMNSYGIMKFLRSKLGPGVPTYTEFTSDLLLPYSGIYAELMDNNGDTRWYRNDTMQIFRLLQPGCSIIVKSELPPGPDGLPGTPIDVYGRLKLTPIIPDFQCGIARPQFQHLIDTYMDGKVWK